jgi:hypothetical protein
MFGEVSLQAASADESLVIPVVVDKYPVTRL